MGVDAVPRARPVTPRRFAVLRLLLRFSRVRYVPLEAAMPPPRRPLPWPRYRYAPADNAAVWTARVRALVRARRAGELTPREYGALLAAASAQWGAWRGN